MEFLQNIDSSVILFIREYLSCGFLDYTMRFISALGNGGFFWIITALIFLFNKNYRKIGIILLLALGLTALIANGLIKPFFERIRPFENLGLDIIINKPHDFSFPSGHTSAAFAAAGVFLYLKLNGAVAMTVLAFLMAFSRLYLCVHYPSDVIVGAILGILISFIVVYSSKKIKKFT